MIQPEAKAEKEERKAASADIQESATVQLGLSQSGVKVVVDVA